MKNPYILSILFTDVLSIFICSVLAYGSIFESSSKSRRSKIYTILVLTNTLALVCDGLSWIFDGRTDKIIIVFVTSVVSIVISLILQCLFAMYIGGYVTDITKKKNRFFSASYIMMVSFTLITFVLCLLNKIFIIENGVYKEGKLYGLYLIFNIIGMIDCIVLIFAFRDKFGRHDTIATLLYLFFPFLCTMICLYYQVGSFAYQATTVSLLVIYVLIQSEQSHKLEKEKQTTEYFAKHDELTGLPNRRAFTDRLDQLSSLEGTMGLIYSDINGLKYENDHFGHRAGDKKLKDYAHVLSTHFSSDEIYRISGDEFVVFCINISQDNFNKKVNKFDKALFADNKKIACIGSEFGICRKVEELIPMAEKKMYFSKEQYHKKHPEINR